MKRAAGLVLMATVCLSAGEFWDEKRYTELTEKQAQHLLTKSPWARSQHTFLSPRAGSTGMISVMVHVRFETALPVRQAMAIVRVSDLPLTSASAQSVGEKYYVVGISGLPRHLTGPAPYALSEEAVLKFKGRAPIRAARSTVRPGGRLFLYFPREGSPITVEDGAVEVEVKLPQFTIQQTFRLKDMVYHDKLEL